MVFIALELWIIGIIVYSMLDRISNQLTIIIEKMYSGKENNDTTRE